MTGIPKAPISLFAIAKTSRNRQVIRAVHYFATDPWTVVEPVLGSHSFSVCAYLTSRPRGSSASLVTVIEFLARISMPVLLSSLEGDAGGQPATSAGDTVNVRYLGCSGVLDIAAAIFIARVRCLTP